MAIFSASFDCKMKLEEKNTNGCQGLIVWLRRGCPLPNSTLLDYELDLRDRTVSDSIQGTKD